MSLLFFNPYNSKGRLNANSTQIIPYVFGSVYNASKAALHSFSDTLRVELAPYGYVYPKNDDIRLLLSSYN